MVTAILVTNITYADYITGSVVGAIYKLPVYSVRQDPQSISQTIQMLLQNNVTNVIIIGGPAVISNLLLQDLNQSGINYIQVWGVTRYETSADVALYFWNSSNSAVIITRDLVNSEVDGSKLQLVTEAVQTAEDNNAPILIVPDGVLPSETVYALQKLNVTNVDIFVGNSGDLGNITDQLNSLSINYKIYTPNITPNLQCSNYIYVNITQNTSWEDIRYVFVGKIHNSCIVPVVSNSSVNVIFEKDQIENEIEQDYEQDRTNNLNASMVLAEHINRLIGSQVLLIYKFEILCNATNNQLPICTILPQLNQSLQQTIQELKSGNVTAIPYILSTENQLNAEDLVVTRQVGEGFQQDIEQEQFQKIKQKIDNIENEIEQENSNINIHGGLSVNITEDQENSDNLVNISSNNQQNSVPYTWGG